MIAVAAPRRFTPWRWNQSTAGLSASVRKTAIRIHVRMCRAIQMISSRMRDRDRDPEHRKDRRGPEPDEALLHVEGRITAASDGSAAEPKRAAGIEPARLGWKPRALPLSYARAHIA